MQSRRCCLCHLTYWSLCFCFLLEVRHTACIVTVASAFTKMALYHALWLVIIARSFEVLAVPHSPFQLHYRCTCTRSHTTVRHSSVKERQCRHISWVHLCYSWDWTCSICHINWWCNTRKHHEQWCDTSQWRQTSNTEFCCSIRTSVDQHCMHCN